MNKLKYNSFLLIFLTLVIVTRLFAGYFFGDTRLDNEWGKLFHNLQLTGVLGINIVKDEFLAVHEFAKIGDTVLPSVFMPPLYVFFIYLINLIFGNFINLITAIYSIQIILCILSIYFLFEILKKFENIKISLLILMIFSFYPIYVFSNTQISSVTLQIFLLIYFLYYILELVNKKKIKDLFLFSIISGLLILIRGEFFLFYLLSLLYFFIYYTKNFKIIIFSVFISFLVVSPYLIRNYINFDTVVLTKSFGYNILKGNNPEFKVEGSDEFIQKKYAKNLIIKANNKYEIELDNFYKKEALQIIKNDPIIYLKQYFKKVFAFIFLDLNSSYPNYFNFFHIVPKLVLSIFSLIGGIISLKKKGFFQYLSLYYFLNIFLFSVFFILPRYTLILLPIQLLLVIPALNFLRIKFFNYFR